MERLKQKMSRMLVGLDPNGGLLKELEIIWKGGSLIQSLDYWCISFKCTKCRETSHERYFCKKLPFGSQKDAEVVFAAGVLDEIDLGHSFLIPLDQISASEFIPKFQGVVPVLLKFLSTKEISSSLYGLGNFPP